MPVVYFDSRWCLLLCVRNIRILADAYKSHHETIEYLSISVEEHIYEQRNGLLKKISKYKKRQ